MAEITTEDIQRLEVKMERLGDKLDAIGERLTRLETYQATEADRCPFKGAVIQVESNSRRIGALEIKMNKLELSFTKMIMLMIGAGAAGVGVDKLVSLLGG